MKNVGPETTSCQTPQECKHPWRNALPGNGNVRGACATERQQRHVDFCGNISNIVWLCSIEGIKVWFAGVMRIIHKRWVNTQNFIHRRRTCRMGGVCMSERLHSDSFSGPLRFATRPVQAIIESANLSILILISLISILILISLIADIVLADPLRGGTLLRIIEDWGQCRWMPRIRDSYRHTIRFTGCLTSSIPPICNTMLLEFVLEEITWRIRLWTVGISAPRYMNVVAFMLILCKRGTRPWTGDIPIIIVSFSVVLRCCGWRDNVSDYRRGVDTPSSLSAAFRAATHISTTGMRRALLPGSRVCTGNEVAEVFILPLQPFFCRTELYDLLTLGRGAGVFTLESSAKSYFSACTNESVIWVNLERKLSYLEYISWFGTFGGSGWDGWLSKCLRTPFLLESYFLNRTFSFVNLLTSLFWFLSVFL